MAQDYQLPADQGDSQTAFLNKVNEAAETQRSSFSGATAPTDPAPLNGQIWFETAEGLRVNWGTPETPDWVPIPITTFGLTENAMIVGSPGNELISLAVATNGQIPIGQTSGPPVIASLTGTADEIDITNGAGSITIGLVNPLKLAKGGTGLATATAGDMLTYVSGTAYSALPKGTANQIIGMDAGATTQEYKTITAGSGIGVSHAANAITIAADPYRPITSKYTKTHADLTEATPGVAQTLTIAVPANTIVSAIFVKTGTAFSGGGIATLELDPDAAYFAIVPIAPYDLLAAAGPTNYTSSAVQYELLKTTDAYTIDLTFTPDGAHNLADLTAGSVDIFLTTRLLNL